MGVIGDLNRYTQFQAANAIGDAARNPGGLAGTGAGLAAGMAVGNQMASAMGSAAQAASAPPPITASATASYFVVVGGAQKGPFTLDQLREQVTAGQVQRSTLAWKQGLAQWTPLENVPDLALLFASVPPPLPKE
jgi:membrane protease subunit (stomatin/prohibitin family)